MSFASGDASVVAPKSQRRLSRTFARMPERFDRVTIALDRVDLVLSWTARTALLDQLEAGHGVRVVFEAVGATRPVTLTLAQKAELLLALEQWAEQTPGGFVALPDGIYDLREGLHNDVHDARRQS